jgi:hypothetical protein
MFRFSCLVKKKIMQALQVPSINNPVEGYSRRDAQPPTHVTLHMHAVPVLRRTQSQA